MFKTQEFAKLCSTTKETLFHYDKLGLLKPDQVLKNGYRNYSYSKLMDFHFLSFLKDSGASLKEIEALCQTGANKKSGCSLIKSSEKIEEQISKLETEKIFLKELGALAVEAVEAPLDSLMIQKNSKKSFLLVKTEPQEIFSDSEYSTVLEKTLTFPVPTPVFGILFDSNAAKEERLVILGLLFLKDTVDLSTKIKIKKGQFAVWYGRGDFEAKRKAASTVIREIGDSGFSVDGNILCFNVLEVLSSNKKEAYFKLMIPVS